MHKKTPVAIVIASVFALPVFAETHQAQDIYTNPDVHTQGQHPTVKNYGSINFDMSVLGQADSKGALDVILNNSDTASENTGVIRLHADNLVLTNGQWLQISHGSYSGQTTTSDIALNNGDVTFAKGISLQNANLTIANEAPPLPQQGVETTDFRYRDLNNYFSNSVKAAIYDINLKKTF